MSNPTPPSAPREARTSVGDQFPLEQARLRELVTQYRAIGPAGSFGAAIIETTLKRADEAMASGDIVQILRAFTDMQEITG